jgi:hypothetical protein
MMLSSSVSSTTATAGIAIAIRAHFPAKCSIVDTIAGGSYAAEGRTSSTTATAAPRDLGRKPNADRVIVPNPCMHIRTIIILANMVVRLSANKLNEPLTPISSYDSTWLTYPCRLPQHL